MQAAALLRDGGKINVLQLISSGETRRPMTAFLYVYVDDTGATYQRALDAGARSLEGPSDMPYGDRRCMVEDRRGNTWQIAKHTRDTAKGRAQ
jgi:PhnB protein